MTKRLNQILGIYLFLAKTFPVNLIFLLGYYNVLLVFRLSKKILITIKKKEKILVLTAGLLAFAHWLLILPVASVALFVSVAAFLNPGGESLFRKGIWWFFIPVRGFIFWHIAYSFFKSRGWGKRQWLILLAISILVSILRIIFIDLNYLLNEW